MFVRRVSTSVEIELLTVGVVSCWQEEHRSFDPTREGHHVAVKERLFRTRTATIDTLDFTCAELTISPAQCFLVRI